MFGVNKGELVGLQNSDLVLKTEVKAQYQWNWWW